MKKEFIQLSRAWYGETCLKDRRNISDEVTVMVTTDDEGGFSEFTVKWEILQGKLCPKVGLFSDAWRLFRLLPDLFDELANRQDQDPTPEEFCDLLQELHFIDATEEANP